MGNIKELYENINFLTYPKVISDALTRFGHKKNSLENKWLPEFIEISFPKFSYYILFQHYNRQQHTTFKDINGNTLKGKELTSLYKEYAKGFNDAYNEYENKINNNNNSIFTKTDEFFAEKIYSNVFNGSNGSIAGIGGKSINGKGYLYYTKENFYKGGFNGGEFYKGIEIILNNPVVFEPVFKRHKNSQKTNNIKQPETIDLSNTKGTENKNPYPKYCEIGSLFAQGLIHKKGFNFYYKKRQFEDCSKLSRYLQEKILKIKTDVRQYIDGTLKDQSKNFYKSKTRMKNIIDYCNENNIKITEDFQSKYNDLVNLH